jgi:hypothetical protein
LLLVEKLVRQFFISFSGKTKHWEKEREKELHMGLDSGEKREGKWS